MSSGTAGNCVSSFDWCTICFPLCVVAFPLSLQWFNAFKENGFQQCSEALQWCHYTTESVSSAEGLKIMAIFYWYCPFSPLVNIMYCKYLMESPNYFHIWGTLLINWCSSLQCSLRFVSFCISQLPVYFCCFVQLCWNMSKWGMDIFN